MRHILSIAPEIIKLDRSLIATIDGDPARRALAASLVQFATGIGSQLVAEGVERPAERAACSEVGIRYAQGYLLGRPGPLPSDEPSAGG
jgi:EAL domain-containing protein (putative c-di-GMP-specific phosphodiesterase class I)